MISAASQWQLTGNAPEIYDKYIAPAVAAPWYPLFIETALPVMHGNIADIGCGTGAFLAHFLEQKALQDCNVYGIDINAEMIAIARKKLPASVALTACSVEELPWQDNFLQLAFCQQGIQYFNNKSAALTEIHRTLQPQGMLIANVWSTIENCFGYNHLAETIIEVAGNKAKDSLYAPFSFPNPKALKALAEAAGFTDVTVKEIDNVVRFASVKEYVLRRIYGSPLIADLPKDNLAAMLTTIVSKMELLLQDYVSAHGMSFPVKANFLIARK